MFSNGKVDPTGVSIFFCSFRLKYVLIDTKNVLPLKKFVKKKETRLVGLQLYIIDSFKRC